MAQKTLNAYVVIGGRVDNSFGRIGTALINMGSTIDEVGRKLIDFGKESIEVYRDYEDSMLLAEGALAARYGQSSRELKGVMRDLDEAAKYWAHTSSFTSDDMANGILLAARAGWDFEEIMDGIPAAMNLARAGGLDLSQGLNYIITSTQAAGVEFRDLEKWIDNWAFAANNSAGSIDEFGQAIDKMGATARFAANPEELFTMLAVLHNNGTKASAAGTLLRNTMIRLIAPTKKAGDVMDELGISEGDLSEALGEANGDLNKAAESLAKVGFSAYDEKGNLKGFVQIFTELDGALQGMTESERNNILGSIFPTRTITGALAFLDAASNGFDGLYASMRAGDAEGYGQYLSELMMSGVTGSTKLFESKIENLKLMIGEQLAPQLESVQANFGKLIDLLATGGTDNGVSSGLDMVERLSGYIGTFADKLGEVDPAVFDALVAGLGAIGTLGPGLIAAGTAFRFIGFALGTNVGRLALAAAVVYSLAEAVNKFREAKFKEAFGNMDLDTTELKETLNNIHDDFTNATSGVTAFKDALNESITKYNEASQAFSSQSLSDMLTQKKLTETDLQKYQSWGEEMVKSVKQGITESADMSAEFWMALFKGKNGTDDDLKGNSIFAGIIGALNEEKEGSILQVEAIGQQLQDALTAAFADGKLSEEEYENIKSYFRDLNEKMVEAQREAQDEQDFVKRKMLMDKAQNMSYNSMMTFIDEDLGTQRQEELDWWETSYKGNRYALQYYYEKALAEAKTDAERAELDAYYQPLLAGADEAYAKKRNEVYAEYDQMILDIMDVAAHESDLSEADAFWNNLIDQVQEGSISSVNAWDMMRTSEFAKKIELFDSSERNKLQKFYDDEVGRLGGEAEIERRIAQYTASGNTVMAARLQDVLDKYKYIGQMGSHYQGDEPENMLPWDMLERINAMAQAGDADILNYFTALPTGDARGARKLWRKLSQVEKDTVRHYKRLVSDKYNLKSVISGDAIANSLYGDDKDFYAAWKVMNMSAEESRQYLKEPITMQLPEGSEVGTAFFEQTQGALDELGKLTVGAEVTGGTDAASAAHGEMQSYADAHAVTFRVSTVGAGSVGTGSINPGGGPMDFQTIKMKAKGGRETQPSIFAEAGIPEWYIPEEHSNNTLDLILAAAFNSGFSMLDLAERAGARMFAEGGTDGSGSLNWSTLPAAASSGSGSGGNDGGSGGGIMVQYSPVIHADNAQGVESVLQADKKRLEKWMEEWWARRQLYESMVTYQ